MNSTLIRLLLVLALSAMAIGALPATALAGSDLHVCTWLTQEVGDAVGTTSAAPDSVLGPNNGGLPGGDKGPYPIYFSDSEALLLATSTGNSSCA